MGYFLLLDSLSVSGLSEKMSLILETEEAILREETRVLRRSGDGVGDGQLLELVLSEAAIE